MVFSILHGKDFMSMLNKLWLIEFEYQLISIYKQGTGPFLVLGSSCSYLLEPCAIQIMDNITLLYTNLQCFLSLMQIAQPYLYNIKNFIIINYTYYNI